MEDCNFNNCCVIILCNITLPACTNTTKYTILELSLKSNPIADRRLLKLIDQCRTKQVLDYVKQHCTKSTTLTQSAAGKGKNRKGRKKSIDEIENDVSIDYKYSINVKHFDDNFKVRIDYFIKLFH